MEVVNFTEGAGEGGLFMSILKPVMSSKDNSVGHSSFDFQFCYFECYYSLYPTEELLKINTTSNKYSFRGISVCYLPKWRKTVGEIFHR